MIPRGQADLILGLEPVEAARSCYYASKSMTIFVIDTYPIKPVYLNILGQTYPSDDEIKKMIEPFSKRSIFVDASNICEKRFGNPIFGNVMAIAVALSSGLLELSKESVLDAIKSTVSPTVLNKNIEAFKLGMGFKA